MRNPKLHGIAIRPCRSKNSPKLHHRSLGLLHQHLYQTGWQREEHSAASHVTHVLRADRLHRTRLTRERLHSNDRFRKQGSRFHI